LLPFIDPKTKQWSKKFESKFFEVIAFNHTLDFEAAHLYLSYPKLLHCVVDQKKTSAAANEEITTTPASENCKSVLVDYILREITILPAWGKFEILLSQSSQNLENNVAAIMDKPSNAVDISDMLVATIRRG
jgi:hypothetical protein